MRNKLFALGLVSVAIVCGSQTKGHAFYPRHYWLARHYCIQPQYNAFTPCCSCDPCGGRCWTPFGFTHGHGGHHGHGPWGYGYGKDDLGEYLYRWNTLYRYQWPKPGLWDHLKGWWGHKKPECGETAACEDVSCAATPTAPAATPAPVPPAMPMPAPAKPAPPAQTSLPYAYPVHGVSYSPYHAATGYAPTNLGPAIYVPIYYAPYGYTPYGFYPMPYAPMTPVYGY